MIKNGVLLVSVLFLAFMANAQTKVFKEVGEEISSQVRAITQDNALVGYLVFTKLEKADENTFNYKITIMDENLNDIGTVKFTEGMIDLRSVSFEQDVLCLGYTKVSFVTVPNENPKKKPRTKEIDELFTQFISLDGKILNTYSTDVVLTPLYGYRGLGLFHGMQVKNLSKKGFVIYYGDKNRDALLVFDTKGNLLWNKRLLMYAESYYMHTSGKNIYMLTKVNDLYSPEGGYKLYAYLISDTAEFKYNLKDNNGNSLKVLTFDNDPVSGKAYLTGCIINPEHRQNFTSARDYSNGPYVGLFTLNIGNTPEDMAGIYSYWNKSEMPGVTETGLFTNNEFFVHYTIAFKDYEGNTIFAGAALVEKKFLGAARYKLADGVFVRQDANAQVKLDNNIPCDETENFGPAGNVAALDKKDFYRVVNNETKTNYVIINDDENTFIYNVNAKKIMRTIQHKDGKIKTSVFPAKEGHVMISEYNRKEKYTRFSIEVL